MKYARRITITVAVLASLTTICGSTASALQVWNAATDYVGNVLPPVGIGPEGAWSYGKASAYNPADPLPGTTYTLLPFDTFGTTGVGANCYSFSGSLPVVRAPDWWTGRWSTYTYAGSDTATLLRWTAQRAITIGISGYAQCIAEAGPLWFIVRKNSDTVALYQRTMASGNAANEPITASGPIGVVPGDVIDTIIGIQPGTTSSSWVVTDLTITELAEAAPPVFTPPGGVYSAPQTVSITCTTPGATIKYTTDGSDPSATNGTEYTAPIPVSSDTTIKARAFASGLADSGISTATYQFAVVTPVFSPDGGSYAHPRTVTITCATPEATIKYTTDGTDPSATNGAVYSAPVLIAVSGTTLKAKAFKSGLPDSAVKSATYVYTGSQVWNAVTDYVGNVLPPVGIGPEGAWSYGKASAYNPADPLPGTTYTLLPFDTFGDTGVGTSCYSFSGALPVVRAPDWWTGRWSTYTYAGSDTATLLRWTAPRPITVEISGESQCIAAADPLWFIVRKNNGSVALYQRTMSSDYADNEPITASGPVVVEPGDVIDCIVGVQPGTTTSSWVVTDLTITEVVDSERTAAPVFTPPGGVYSAPRTVSITCITPGATIKYTTDGSDPSDTNGTEYTSPIAVSSDTTIKARAFASGLPDSGISTATYQFAVATPVFSPDGGTYAHPRTVTITCATPEATIKYTTDGTDPSSINGAVYSSPVLIAVSGTALKAKAFKSGLPDSAVKSATYIYTGSQVWNSTTDYVGNVLPPVGIGPEGAWSYGRTSAYNAADPPAAPYSLIPYDAFSSGENRYWFTGGVSGSIVWGADAWTNRFAMYTHPGTDTASLLRWTAPRAITVEISGNSQCIAQVDSLWFIVRKKSETTALYQRIMSTSDYANQPITGGTVVVEPGDVIDVIAGLKAGSSPGSSWVIADLTITEVAYSERTAAPVFTPPGGAYIGAQSVAITCATAGATIKYTTDGSVPSGSNGAVYSAPIAVSGNTTIKAGAFKSGLPDSSVSIADYTIVADLNMNISDIKGAANSTPVGTKEVIVTARFGDTFYVQEPDRSAGIRVDMPGNTASVGRKVKVAGTIMTDDATGERYIQGTALSDLGAGSAAPLGMNNRALGGGPDGLQEGITGAAGRNNMGLLVTAYGETSAGGGGVFSLDDGSDVAVKVVLPAGATVPLDGTYVSVIGISSCEKVAGNINRLIKSLGEVNTP